MIFLVWPPSLTRPRSPLEPPLLLHFMVGFHSEFSVCTKPQSRIYWRPVGELGGVLFGGVIFTVAEETANHCCRRRRSNPYWPLLPYRCHVDRRVQLQPRDHVQGEMRHCSVLISSCSCTSSNMALSYYDVGCGFAVWRRLTERRPAGYKLVECSILSPKILNPWNSVVLLLQGLLFLLLPPNVYRGWFAFGKC